MDIESYWRAVLAQDESAIREYFEEDAYVNWHNTDEHFSVGEFIRANCEYPGCWAGEVERVERAGELVITAVHVWEREEKTSFHVTSFFQLCGEKIRSIDEYWGDDGPAPEWRQRLGVGTPILRRPPSA